MTNIELGAIGDVVAVVVVADPGPGSAVRPIDLVD